MRLFRNNIFCSISDSEILTNKGKESRIYLPRGQFSGMYSFKYILIEQL